MVVVVTLDTTMVKHQPVPEALTRDCMVHMASNSRYTREHIDLLHYSHPKPCSWKLPPKRLALQQQQLVHLVQHMGAPGSQQLSKQLLIHMAATAFAAAGC